MTQMIVFAVGGFGLLLGIIALLRWREDRKITRRQDAITAREHENVALWSVKETKRSREPRSRGE